jgi:cytochrome c oxidase assembly protein subunit 15
VLSRLRERPSAATVRRLALAALAANAGIVVSGGAVRLTGSGLGCPTWPRCTDASFVATPEMGLHGAIEFGNRLLTWVLVAVVVACVAATLRQRPRRTVLVRLSWALLAGVLAQALLGGVTVLTGLHPVTVMAHFLLSMVLVAVAVVLYERSGETDGPARSLVGRALRLGGRLLVGVTAATLVLGTVVTGTGPHSGDVEVTDRLPIDPVTAVQLHADLVFLLLGLLVGLLLAMQASAAPSQLRRRLLVLLGVVLGQGVVGYVQYLTDLPVVLVGVHLLGACLVWIAALRVLLAMRERVGPGRAPGHASALPEPRTAATA